MSQELVTVLRGSVLDVAVDVRTGNPTFGRQVAVELDDVNRLQLWIPRGFAHGFIVRSENADFFYKCDEFYCPSNERILRWTDPALAIDWGNLAPTVSAHDLLAERVIPIRTDEYPTRAKRPLNSRLDLDRLKHVFGITPLS